VPIPDLPLPNANAKSTTGPGAKGDIDANQDAVGPQQSGGRKSGREIGWSSLSQRQVIALMTSVLSRQARGIYTPDPMQYTFKVYMKLLKKQGLSMAPDGKIVGRSSAKESPR
jgi:hypothetical protein